MIADIETVDDTKTMPTPDPPQARLARLLSRYNASPMTGVLIVLAVLVILLSMTQRTFLTWPNITNIINSNSVLLLMAVGATFVIIAGGIDLSAAGALVTTGMLFGLCLSAGLGFWLSLLVLLLAGATIGTINAFLITKVKISFLVVTLGAGTVWASVALVLNGGNSVSVFTAPGFNELSAFVNGSVFGIPYLLIFDVLVVAIASVVLRVTTYGRALFAVGSNAEAARLSGLNVDRVTAIVYVVASFMAGVGAAVLLGRLASAPASADPNLFLNVIAAVLIGGTNVGVGGVGATIAGVAFLGVAQNGLTLSGVSPFWQGVISGSILIVAVGIGGVRRRRIRAKSRKAEASGVEPSPAAVV